MKRKKFKLKDFAPAKIFKKNILSSWIFSDSPLKPDFVPPGFLLGGIGELNKNRQPNFLVVDKSTAVSDIEVKFFTAIYSY